MNSLDDLMKKREDASKKIKLRDDDFEYIVIVNNDELAASKKVLYVLLEEVVKKDLKVKVIYQKLDTDLANAIMISDKFNQNETILSNITVDNALKEVFGCLNNIFNANIN